MSTVTIQAVQAARRVKILSDSASDLLALPHIPFETAPLKIITDKKEYVDNHRLSVEGMVNDLKIYKGRSSTSCPNTEEWLAAFGDAEEIYCVTLTGTLSGSYNAAMTAKLAYRENISLREACVRLGFLTPEKFDAVFHPEDMA